jgi:hypothetical protein
MNMAVLFLPKDEMEYNGIYGPCVINIELVESSARREVEIAVTRGDSDKPSSIMTPEANL